MFDIFSYLFDADFLCVFETSLLQVFHAKGTRRPHFRRALGVIWNTISTNMEKLKLRFRVGGYAKIKLWRACVSPCFVRSMCRFSGPLFFMLRLTICHHFTHLCIHWKPIFYNILQLFRPSFSSTQKIEKSDWTRNLVGSTCGTSRVMGEQGSIWEASGKHLGGIWASGIWEASGRHLGGISGHLGSIWEASGKHQGGIWEASGRHPP